MLLPSWWENTHTYVMEHVSRWQTGCPYRGTVLMGWLTKWTTIWQAQTWVYVWTVAVQTSVLVCAVVVAVHTSLSAVVVVVLELNSLQSRVHSPFFTTCLQYHYDGNDTIHFSHSSNMTHYFFLLSLPKIHHLLFKDTNTFLHVLICLPNSP